MNKFIFTLIVIISFASCKRNEFEPKPKNNFIDTTFYITLNGNNDFYYYPNYNISLDATTNDSSAIYSWQPGGETTPIISIEESGNYILHYYSDSTGDVSINILIHPFIPSMYVPNSFSPSTDGLNDSWRPIYSGITSIYYEVRDNDGIKLFSTNDLKSKGWNGTYSGSIMPSGFYLYYINYSTLTASNNILTGSLELIR